MHSKLRDAFCALAGAGAMAVVFYTAMPVLGQQKPATTAGIPRLNGKPDLNGVWQALNSANWDLEAHSARVPRWPCGRALSCRCRPRK